MPQTSWPPTSPLWRAKGVLAAGRRRRGASPTSSCLAKVMGNWWFVLATAVIALALPAVGRAVRPDAFEDPAGGASRASRRPAAASPTAATELPVVEGVADARS